jgi:hypothetical protein
LLLEKTFGIKQKNQVPKALKTKNTANFDPRAVGLA